MQNNDHAGAATPLFPLWSYRWQNNSKLIVRSRKELEVKLITAAFEDETFRHKLLTHPRQAVEKVLGATLPDNLVITVLEETEQTKFLVIPSNPYAGVDPSVLDHSPGMPPTDVARWVLEQQSTSLLNTANGAEILARAWHDADFKRSLVDAPAALLKGEYGYDLPRGLEIRVVEETVDTLYIVLPVIKDEMSFLLRSRLPDLEEQGVLVIGLTTTVNNHP